MPVGTSVVNKSNKALKPKAPQRRAPKLSSVPRASREDALEDASGLDSPAIDTQLPTPLTTQPIPTSEDASAEQDDGDGGSSEAGLGNSNSPAQDDTHGSSTSEVVLKDQTAQTREQHGQRSSPDTRQHSTRDSAQRSIVVSSATKAKGRRVAFDIPLDDSNEETGGEITTESGKDVTQREQDQALEALQSSSIADAESAGVSETADVPRTAKRKILTPRASPRKKARTSTQPSVSSPPSIATENVRENIQSVPDLEVTSANATDSSKIRDNAEPNAQLQDTPEPGTTASPVRTSEMADAVAAEANEDVVTTTSSSDIQDINGETEVPRASKMVRKRNQSAGRRGETAHNEAEPTLPAGVTRGTRSSTKTRAGTKASMNGATRANPQAAEEHPQIRARTRARQNSAARTGRKQRRGGKRGSDSGGQIEPQVPLLTETTAIEDERQSEDSRVPHVGQVGNNDTPADVPRVGSEEEQVTNEESASPTGRVRAETPDEDKNHEIDVTLTSIAELTEHTKRGRKSKLEEKMQGIDWTEVKRRRKQEEEERVARAMNPREDESEEELPNEGEAREEASQAEDELPQKLSNRKKKGQGPRLKWVNGEMVFDNDSLVREHEALVDDENVETVEQNDVTRRVTSHSWINSNRRDPVERARSSNKSDPWSEAETEAFYDALRGFGTDFYLISKMFPGKTRNHVKRKFVREEKANPDRIRRALIQESVELDMDVFLAASNRTEEDYRDPEELEEELRQAREEQREQIEREKAERDEKDRKRQEKAREKAEAQAKGTRKKRERKKKGKGGAGEADGDGPENIEPYEIDGGPEVLVVGEGHVE